jgi:NAD(P)-dependent dehydrogenase (short-subunit alcohol dehydrogenase family)
VSSLSTGVAVVTGAGSGIGRALAQQLAAGSALGVAIDEAGLLQTAQSLEKKSALVTTHVVDVAKEEVVRSFAEDVGKRHGRVTLLINNAGVALEGTFEEISLDDEYQFLGHGVWRQAFPADTETGGAFSHRQPFERFWPDCSCGPARLFRQQVCGARIHGMPAA